MSKSEVHDRNGRKSKNSISDFNLFSPTDYRYSVKELIPYLSEEANIRYKAKVEAALAMQLERAGICPKGVAAEITRASEKVRAWEVYEEETRIKHDIRSLVNIIRRNVSDRAKPFVHLAATSYDIVDTANAMRFKDAVIRIVLPDLIKLETHLINISKLHSATLQIGRTHGQHAEPITFGYFVSYYVSRLGKRMLKLKEVTDSLTGKFSGAVGVYGPLSLMLDDPEKFEGDLLGSIGLVPTEVSTQIVQPEPIADFIHCFVSTLGVLANFSRDIRNLQRSEIGEVSEDFGQSQVGSSTMPQKRNPISFENVESLWKRFMPQMVTVYLDQISEHQRDLTNSSSQRYLPELVVAFDYCVRRLDHAIWNEKTDQPRLRIDSEKMRRNIDSSLDQIAAEPLYILLALGGHPDAHESVSRVIQESFNKRINLVKKVRKDKELSSYLNKIEESRWKFVENPETYIGLAQTKSERIARTWEKRMSELKLSLDQTLLKR